jgi:hypothetical protein
LILIVLDSWRVKATALLASEGVEMLIRSILTIEGEDGGERGDSEACGGREPPATSRQLPAIWIRG